jgi:hypothetical protein
MESKKNLAQYVGKEVRIESLAPEEIFEGVLYGVCVENEKYVCEIFNQHGQREKKEFYFVKEIQADGMKVPLDAREEIVFQRAQEYFGKQVGVKDRTYSSFPQGPLEGRIVGLRLDGNGNFQYTLQRNDNKREERYGIYLDDICILNVCSDGDALPIVGQQPLNVD